MIEIKIENWDDDVKILDTVEKLKSLVVLAPYDYLIHEDLKSHQEELLRALEQVTSKYNLYFEAVADVQDKFELERKEHAREIYMHNRDFYGNGSRL